MSVTIQFSCLSGTVWSDMCSSAPHKIRQTEHQEPLKSSSCFGLFPFPSQWASQVVLVVKKPPAKAGDLRDSSSIPGSGRSPGGGNGNTVQHSCLENPTDRGAWRIFLSRSESEAEDVRQRVFK